MKKIFSLAVIMPFLFLALHVAGQADGKTMTTREAKEWFASKQWPGGLQLHPHKTVNIPELARQYRLNPAYWDKAFAFLKEHDLQAMDIGRISIDSNNVYAMVTENPTKDYDSTKWESHRKYLDIHYVISGTEKIGVSPVTKLTVVNPYDESKDLINYSGKGKTYAATPEKFFIFFPSDAHRPGITAAGDKKADKKIVIKIRYAD